MEGGEGNGVLVLLGVVVAVVKMEGEVRNCAGFGFEGDDMMVSQKRGGTLRSRSESGDVFGEEEARRGEEERGEGWCGV